jgi:hypothetical protein
MSWTQKYFSARVEEVSARSAIRLQTATPVTNNPAELAEIVEGPVPVESTAAIVQEELAVEIQAEATTDNESSS